MKKNLLLFTLYIVLGLHLNVQAQTKREGILTKVQFSLKYPDTSNNALLASNTNIKEIVVGYYDYKPIAVYVYFDEYGSRNPKKEFYHLSFKADSMYLAYKYGYIDLRVPEFQLEFIDYKRDSCNSVDEVRSRIKLDTTSYRFFHNCLPEGSVKREPRPGIGFPAFNRAQKTVEEGFLKAYASVREESAIDSSVVFRAFITKEGEMQDLKLLVGRSSKFSDIVVDELKKTANNWKPAMITGLVSAYVRIYARLNSDGSLFLETPKTLGSFTGE